MRPRKRGKYARRVHTTNPPKYKVHGNWLLPPGLAAVTGTTLLCQRLQTHRISFPNASLSLTVVSSAANGAVEFGHRTGANIMVKGVRYYQELYANTDKPVVFNFALLQTKVPTIVTPGNVRTEFFADYADPINRYSDFVDDSTGSLGYRIDYKMYGLNSGKFNILTHKRYILDPKEIDGQNGTTGVTRTQSSKGGRIHKTINTWMPLNKTFAFDDPMDNFPQNELFAVFWWTPLNGLDYNDLKDTSQNLHYNIYTQVSYTDA